MNKYPSLTPEVLQILRAKATEPPFSGKYLEPAQGSYLCRGCGQVLFRGDNQFHSGCGWPSFDQEITGAIIHRPDNDGRRTEILCGQCQGHLGHVFKNEGFTARNTRHCVNSLAMEFVPDTKVQTSEEIIFAAGCFWGVEHLLKQQTGVLLTQVGYCGGKLAYPTYQAICTGQTGHLEAVRVVFDPDSLKLEALIKYFFEIHDFTQQNGQGPDLGTQYLSAIFYYSQNQRLLSAAVIDKLMTKGYEVTTQLYPVSTFWPAEDYHQNYYQKTAKTPYCHFRRALQFDA